MAYSVPLGGELVVFTLFDDRFVVHCAVRLADFCVSCSRACVCVCMIYMGIDCIMLFPESKHLQVTCTQCYKQPM